MQHEARMKCNSCGGQIAPLPEFHAHGCWKCGSCGLVACLPFPNNVNLQYDDDYFDRRQEHDQAGVSAKVESFRPLAADLRRTLGGGAKVFEVGAAVGALVRALRDEGLKADGLELSEAAARTAKTILDVELVSGSVDADALPPNNDAVLALHVIEHLVSPRRFVENAWASLKPGGLLVIEVPDFGAPLRERLGPDWPYFRPGEHLYHFTEASLRRLMTDHGFAVRRVERHGGLGLLVRDSHGPDGWQEPAGLCRLLFRSRGVVYRVPGAKRVIRWLNYRIGYQILRRHAHLRIWADRIERPTLYRDTDTASA